MIKDTEIQALLDRIESSKALGSSSTYARLLRFLVECTLSNTVPKEQSIAAHLFGSNSAKTDTSKIRVYVFHLRKKLTQYFENDGRDEKYILNIPKGGYRVVFNENNEGQAETLTAQESSKKITALWPIIGLIAASLLVHTYLFYQQKEVPENVIIKSALWDYFAYDEKPLQIVLGDLIVFSEVDAENDEVSNIRLPEINTTQQYEEYKELPENAHRNLIELSYTHLSKGSAEWISSLTKLFHPTREFSIEYSSRVEAKDMHDYNIVYIGMQKTAGILNKYFEKSTIDFDISKPEEYRLNDDILTPMGDPDNTHTDYGFIAKYPGPNDNAIIMFSGLWDSAASEALRTLTIATKMAELENYMISELGHVPDYFEMLIEVNGVDRIGFESKVKYLKEIGGD